MVRRHAARAILVSIMLTGLVGCSPEQGDPSTSDKELVLADTARAVRQSPSKAGIKMLQVRYRNGEVFRYRAVQESEGGPDTARTTSKSTHYYTRMVRSTRSDGSYETVLRFDSITVTGTIRNVRTGATLMEQSYRSSDTSAVNRKRFPQFSSLIGEEVLVYISPDGRVQQVGDVSPIVRKIALASTQPMPPAALEQVAAQLKNGIYAAFTLQEFVPFPKQPIDSTGTWVNEQQSPLSEIFTVLTRATYSIDRVYDLKGRRIGAVTANVVGSVRAIPLPKNSPLSISLQTSQIAGSSSAVMDVDRGFTVSKKNQITMSMTARVGLPQGGQQTVTQSQTSRYEVELLP